MSPDDSRLSYPVDSSRSDSEPVSARSTSTESIPIVTTDAGKQPAENRRMRRARLGTGPVATPSLPSPAEAPEPVAPPQPEAERAMPEWDSVVQSAAERVAPPWEPAGAAPVWEPDAAHKLDLEPAPPSGSDPSAVPRPAAAAQPAPVDGPPSLEALLSAATGGSAPLTPPPGTVPPQAGEQRQAVQPGTQPKAAKPGRRPKAPKPGRQPRPPKQGRGTGEASPTTAPQSVAVKQQRPRPDQLRIGGVPKVDLLPPELKSAREWRQARNRSLLIVLLALLLVLAGIAGATGWAQVHALARDISQSRTDDLLAQQSEFVDVNQLRGDISAAQQALGEASASDIAWIPFLTELSATIPAQSRLTTLTIEMPSPGTPLTAPTDALQGERVATVRFTALSAGVPDVAAWSRAIEQMGGVVFVAPRATSKVEDGAGYEVEMTFDISAERLRNPPEALDDEQAEAEEDAP